MPLNAAIVHGLYLNILDFGAYLDGVHDDTQAFIDANASASNYGQATIFVPQGTPLISRCLTFAPNVRVLGAGKNVSMFKAVTGGNWNTPSPSSWKAVVCGLNNDGVAFSHIGVDANNENASGIAIMGGDYCSITDCLAKNNSGHSGIHFYGGQTSSVRPVQHGTMSRNVVNNCIWNYAFDGDEVNCEMNDNISINPVDSHFSCDTDQSATGIGVGPISMSGNVGYGGGTSPNQASSNGIYLNKINEVSCTGNTISGYHGNALLHIKNGNVNVTGNKLSGDVNSNPTYGIYHFVSNESKIAHNVIKHATQGIFLAGFTAPLFSKYSDNLFVHCPTLFSGQSSIPAGMHFEGNRQTNATFTLFQPFNLPLNLPTLPLVSGTIYQNTSGQALIIHQPVYATTPSTSGSIQVNMSPTSTPALLYTKFVNGATTSGVPDVITIEVPPSHYYQFTGSGVTLASATIYQRA